MLKRYPINVYSSVFHNQMVIIADDTKEADLIINKINKMCKLPVKIVRIKGAPIKCERNNYDISRQPLLFKKALDRNVIYIEEV